MGCKNPKILWNGHGFKKMEVGDLLPGSDTGLVTQEIIDRLKSGDLGEQYRSLIRAGYYLKVDCKSCASCITKAINSRVGAMLAETATATTAAAITFTYANDVGSDTRADMAHKVLTKRHVSEMFERIRKDRSLGHCRYFVAGEYGELLGRAHFHGIFFGYDGKFPEFDYSSPISHSRLWRHGHIHAKPFMDPKQALYAAKYSVKALSGVADNNAFLPGVEASVSVSRYPPLGADFFRDLGREQGDYAVPLSFQFMPPGGEARANYSVKGRASRRLMVDAYLDCLAEQGFDVSFYAVPPKGYQRSGPLIPVSPNPWIAKAIDEAIRDRHLASLPLVTPQQEAAEVVAEFEDRQARQERINAAQAARRNALAVKLAYERNERALRGYRDDINDPVWDDWDGASYAALARQIANGKW